MKHLSGFGSKIRCSPVFLLKSKICYFLAGLIALGFSCTSVSTPKPEPYKNKLGIKPAIVAQIDTAHYTTIKWINPACNIGTVKEGDSVFMKFWYENTGEHPLFISEVSPACGCTIPSYPENSLMPGERAYLSAYFNTNNQEGHVDKTIIVTTNTANSVKHLLKFHGTVIQRQAN